MSIRDNERFSYEYDACTTGCGYHALTNWSVMTLSGADRQKFLRNMCTNDIRKLTAGEGCEAFLTDVKGKIVAHLFVLLRDDRIVLLTVPEQAPAIISHLDRYIIREDVQLADVSQAEAWHVLSGSGVDSALPGKLETQWQSATYHLGDVDCLIVRFPLPGRNAYLISASHNGVAALRKVLADHGGVECGEEAWSSVRVESGLPLFGVDFDHSNLPQEVARNAQAISFTKGCYLGQETIARLDALGHVNKQLVTLKFDAAATPTPGLPLTYEGQSAGTATSVGWSPRLGAPLALGMVRRGSNAVGTQLESSQGPLEVIATPAIG